MIVRLAAALVAATLSAPAWAQTPMPPVDFLTPTPGVLGIMAEQRRTTMRLSKMRGVDVIGLDEGRIGEVDDVLLERDGRAQAVVIDAGGLIGGKTIALPFDELLWNTGEVSRMAAPSASLSPENAPPAGPADAAAERMPGANVAERALNAVPEGRSGTVDQETGPVTTGTVAEPATVLVASGDGPERAVARMTTADIESAPEFRYADDSR